MNAISPPDPATFPAWLDAELRSDHAGETGAVAIYAGILAVARDPAIRDFAQRHRATEAGHLDALEALLPPARRSWLLPIWRVAGWLTGALPALVGTRAVHATIDAVETFVDHHYAAQIDRLDAERSFPAVRALLEHCRLEEVEHRDEARAAATAPAGPVLRGWAWMVGTGSAAAVAAARRV